MKRKVESGKWKVATRKNAWRVFFVTLATLSTFNFQLSTAQQREIEAQNTVMQRAEERLAEIERLNRVLTGDIVRSERDLRVARSAIEEKRKVAADLENETRRITAQMNADTRATRQLDRELNALRHDYGRMVYAAWKSHKTNNATLFLLSARDFNDASRRIAFIRRYNRTRQSHGERIDSMNRSLQANIERLAVKKNEIASLMAESDRLLANLAQEETRYRRALETLGADRKKLDADAKRERDKIAAAQREINRIMARQTQAARSTTMTEADIALTGQFGDNRGRLPWPTGSPSGGGIILHHFGKEKSADGIESNFNGLIIAAPAEAEVRSVFEGTVTWISDLGQFDKCVMVRSGEYVVGYGNISTPAVKNGDRISTGQTLGWLGSSDNPDRHLVMIWMQRGNTVIDPEEWLR
ncbi:MAG: peptidoglycan DD-metalloendopeptidase family protein [Alistipes sp.]|jgi:septal ring factor EnvC (AmiA/AmiB activator)|nr:peptidoglycan DD-metalloendopeptidase family protein [Alistipes sp.]